MSKTPKRKYICDENVIYFKSNKGNGFAWLSNFWPFIDLKIKSSVKETIQNSSSSFTIENITYPSVEHYFHCMKYAKTWPEAAFSILQQPTALDAKKRNTFFKRQRPIDIKQWDKNKKEFMLNALRAKFSQNPALAKQLIFTGNKKLVEVPGRGRDDWAGEDGWLGKLLMQVRDELKDQFSIEDLIEEENREKQEKLNEIERKRTERAKKQKIDE